MELTRTVRELSSDLRREEGSEARTLREHGSYLEEEERGARLVPGRSVARTLNKKREGSKARTLREHGSYLV
jgi:hypothetical protein